MRPWRAAHGRAGADLARQPNRLLSEIERSVEGGERPVSRAGRWTAATTIALALAASAGIHAAVIGDHYAESGMVGAFFVLVSAVQFLQALAAAARPTRSVWLAVGASNLALVLIWLASRTIGLPVSSGAHGVEAIGVLDASAVALECVVVVGAWRQIRRRRTSTPVPTKTALIVAVSMAVVSGGVSMAAPVDQRHHSGQIASHSHACEAFPGHRTVGAGHVPIASCLVPGHPHSEEAIAVNRDAGRHERETR